MSRAELDLRVVDLPLELASSWPDPTTSPKISPNPKGSSAEIETDQGLFALLLSNIFQNAIDASVDATDAADVDVTWGVTDRSFWVRVTNPFRGQRLAFDDVAPVGFSSKAGHQGRGLALIQRIAALLDVAVALEGASGTASFVVNGERHRG
jgi:sensor histidine kinase regulating citrate/malate metabolism